MKDSQCMGIMAAIIHGCWTVAATIGKGDGPDNVGVAEITRELFYEFVEDDDKDAM